jgi:Do/DeqQ family serine protease
MINPFDQYGPRKGSGSGVIVSKDGYVVTNNHVVDFADEVLVTTNDNRKFTAEVIGTDPQTDLAVLKIDAYDLQTLSYGDSDKARVGEWVLAVGNPFDLNSTVTAGIISAKGRDIDIIQGKNAMEAFIQTDAAVNPGNSGGALVNTEGELIGINTAIASRTGSYVGYSFAIPVNMMKRITEDIIKYGEYRRVSLGVLVRELNSDLSQDLGLSVTQGVVVDDLVSGGSAQYAGVLPNDVILKINGRTVKNFPDLQEMIGRAKVGETINLTLLRKDKTKELPVRLRNSG